MGMAGKLFKADGDAFHLAAKFGDQAGDGAGVDASGEEDADGDIRDEVGADGVSDRVADGLLQLLCGLGLGGLTPVVANVVPTDGRVWLAITDAHPGAAGQGEDAFVQGPGFGHAAPEVKTCHAGGFGGGGDEAGG